MQTSPSMAPLMPTDFPPLSDAAAVEIRDFLHELLFRFEGHYFGQIHRHQEQQRQDRIKPNNVGIFDEDVPF
jgi:hypothetical protein